MKNYRRMAAGRVGTAGVVLAIGLGGAGTLLAGTAAATTPATYVVPAPSAGPVSSQGCIIGLNCGCIRYRTCPGDRRRPSVRTPEPQLEGDVPAVSSDQGLATDLTRTPAWASPLA